MKINKINFNDEIRSLIRSSSNQSINLFNTNKLLEESPPQASSPSNDNQYMFDRSEFLTNIINTEQVLSVIISTYTLSLNAIKIEFPILIPSSSLPSTKSHIPTLILHGARGEYYDKEPSSNYKENVDKFSTKIICKNNINIRKNIDKKNREHDYGSDNDLDDINIDYETELNNINNNNNNNKRKLDININNNISNENSKTSDKLSTSRIEMSNLLQISKETRIASSFNSSNGTISEDMKFINNINNNNEDYNTSDNENDSINNDSDDDFVNEIYNDNNFNFNEIYNDNALIDQAWYMKIVEKLHGKIEGLVRDGSI
jgi:hypothetical protein